MLYTPTASIKDGAMTSVSPEVAIPVMVTYGGTVKPSTFSTVTVMAARSPASGSMT
jgi:hypothetical protein